jgi:hypothetical protein
VVEAKSPFPKLILPGCITVPSRKENEALKKKNKSGAKKQQRIDERNYDRNYRRKYYAQNFTSWRRSKPN